MAVRGSPEILCQIMSEKKPNKLTPHRECLAMLDAIYAYYGVVFNCGVDNVMLHKLVAQNISGRHRWSWRYVVSVKNGTIEPGKKLMRNIKSHYKRIKSKPWRYTRNRIAVNLEDPISAAKSIKAKQPGRAYLERLAEELRK